MTDKLPPNLLALFAPRPPLRYIPPSDRAPDDAGHSTLSGVGQYAGEVQKYGEEVPYHPTESWLQRKARLKQEQKEKLEKHLTEGEENRAKYFQFFISSLDYSHADDSQTTRVRIHKSEEIRTGLCLCRV